MRGEKRRKRLLAHPPAPARRRPACLALVVPQPARGTARPLRFCRSLGPPHPRGSTGRPPAPPCLLRRRGSSAGCRPACALRSGGLVVRRTSRRLRPGGLAAPAPSGPGPLSPGVRAAPGLASLRRSPSPPSRCVALPAPGPSYRMLSRRRAPLERFALLASHDSLGSLPAAPDSPPGYRFPLSPLSRARRIRSCGRVPLLP